MVLTFLKERAQRNHVGLAKRFTCRAGQRWGEVAGRGPKHQKSWLMIAASHQRPRLSRTVSSTRLQWGNICRIIRCFPCSSAASTRGRKPKACLAAGSSSGYAAPQLLLSRDRSLQPVWISAAMESSYRILRSCCQQCRAQPIPTPVASVFAS